ncbi:hypothetical protein BDF19DRAFT_431464 [Syncephalis fuscata]|nr:hypothetical protein BDF19DRAFT_431464 [Syncephalis fuscata]
MIAGNPVLVLCDNVERGKTIFQSTAVLANRQFNVCLPYQLDNKYYRAQLDFCLTTLNSKCTSTLLEACLQAQAYQANDGGKTSSTNIEENSSDDEDNQDKNKIAKTKYSVNSFDAVVFVVHEETAVASLDRLSRSTDRFNPVIRLCIVYTEAGNSRIITSTEDTPIASLTEETLADIQEWCLEHEYELVHTQQDEDVYDTDDGVGRVREALEAHIWPICEMKTNKRDSIAKHNAVATLVPEADDFEERTVDRTLLASSASLLDQNPFLSGMNWTEAGLQLEEDNDIDNALDGDEFTRGNKDLTDDALEQMDGEFDMLLKMMLQARETAASLPDEERHALAARVVTTLARQFEESPNSGIDNILADHRAHYKIQPSTSGDDTIRRLGSTDPYSNEKSADEE